jgi:hypothetical protein
MYLRVRECDILRVMLLVSPGEIGSNRENNFVNRLGKRHSCRNPGGVG